MVVAAFLGKHPAVALFELPVLLWQAMPFIVQLAFGFFFVILQFVGLFWFLSRGGVDTYMPDDVKTRFTDVWGQDNVLDKVKENMVFLEDPESIEKKGGYVPGGILLWGPPGTGKTLMAEAVAGETGKPYVFVDPGAFINMFMGVGILKVKGLFRKLRKLAVRYGGVIVFFDEADALGDRGAQAQGGWGGQVMTPSLTEPACHGISYMGESSQSPVFRSYLEHDAEGPKRDGIIMGGMGGGGMGTLQALLTELPGLKKPPRVLQPHRATHVRDASEASAQVPDPRDDGDQHAASTGRGTPASGSYRPHLQGRLPIEGRPHQDIRRLPGQGSAQAGWRKRSTGSPPSRLTRPVPASRTSSTRR